MRVKSALKGFFNHRLVMRPGIALVMFIIFFTTSSFTEHSDHDLRAKQVNLIIRQIGHRLLLQAGDSTSRVLPVTETKEGTFVLQFENDFVFSHDSLMALTRELLPKTQFPSGYTVTVFDCMFASIVYGFQVSNTSMDILPCRGRHQPAGCYTIEFAFPDFYEKAEQKTDTDKPAEQHKSVQVQPQETRLKPEELKTTALNADIALTGEVKSVNPEQLKANSKPEEFKAKTFDYSLTNLVYSGVLVFFCVTLLVVRFGKILTPEPVQNHRHTIIKESGPELAALGKFRFDVKGQRLLLGREVISLTDKECRILELLNENFGELISRETLMQKIWINEGVITGRSLDMFVSKLRKKLSCDPELRITNVHGKGYRLEILGMQIS